MSKRQRTRYGMAASKPKRIRPDVKAAMQTLLSKMKIDQSKPLPDEVYNWVVREQVRNKWAHYSDSEWSNSETCKFWPLMEDLVQHLSLTEADRRHKEFDMNILRHKGKEILCGNEADPDQVEQIWHDLQEVSKSIEMFQTCRHGSIRDGVSICSVCYKEIQPTEVWIKGAKDNLQNKVDNQDSQRKNEQYAAQLIKLYSWVKQEMVKSEALCIASTLLIKDDKDTREEIELCQKKRRRSAVDKLLKFVLRKNCYLEAFFNILREHSSILTNEKMQKTAPDEEDINEYMRLWEPRDEITSEKLFKDNDKYRFHFKIKSNATDVLNDNFLSKFIFKLSEHDIICDLLDKGDENKAASCLLETMDKCGPDIIVHFCETLKRENVFTPLEAQEVRSKYIPCDTTTALPAFLDNTNPLKDNIQLLTEELEINDHFISFLQMADLLPFNIIELLLKIETRFLKVKRLLELLDPQKEGYDQIKEYVKHTNTYLYDRLMKTEDSIKSQKVVPLVRRFPLEVQTPLGGSVPGCISTQPPLLHPAHMPHSQMSYPQTQQNTQRNPSSHHLPAPSPVHTTGLIPIQPLNQDHPLSSGAPQLHHDYPLAQSPVTDSMQEQPNHSSHMHHQPRIVWFPSDAWWGQSVRPPMACK